MLREWVVGRCGFDGYRDCQWVSRSVLKDLTKDALTISAAPPLSQIRCFVPRGLQRVQRVLRRRNQKDPTKPNTRTSRCSPEKKDQTLIWMHTGHSYYFENAKAIDHGRFKWERLVKEALHSGPWVGASSAGGSARAPGRSPT